MTPDTLDEIDVLKLENWDLKLALARSEFERLAKASQVDVATIREKYAMKPGDTWDMQQKRIVRGKEPAPTPAEPPDGKVT